VPAKSHDFNSYAFGGFQMYAPLAETSCMGALWMVEQVGCNRHKRRLSLYVVLAAIIGISAALVWNYSAIRTSARWLVWSRSYQSKVLAQPASANGDLKHIEWDGLWRPAAINQARSAAYPARSLLYVGLRATGTPSSFYTNEFWGKRNLLNCSGSQAT
jgi:hypothetical protein